MQNGPHVSKVDHTGFYVITKVFTKTFLIGRGYVTFLHITYTEPSKNVGKLTRVTCVNGRFKNPFFLWLIEIFKAATMILVTAITFFGNLCAAQPCVTAVLRFTSETAVRQFQK